ncbi:lymphocyte antigen 6 complex locus protein G6c-like [Rhinatrema bivittatum]|uniref:lymphocyte antigen 6 complex locus protein G6c-like n=1 Tax=Rhinatrema bivittatum TaxID=194408 RepID=UPI0011264AC2|nr:lymphocyte antigen 6 complex locus protein G6c-like [Rhinatrema bivittatum]
MHTILCVALTGLLCLSLASALECNVCSLQLEPIPTCFFQSKTRNCSEGETCGTMTYLMDSTELSWVIKGIRRLDCVSNSTCNQILNDTLLNQQYNTTCCDENACNTGAGVLARASLIAGMALLSVWLLQLL